MVEDQRNRIRQDSFFHAAFGVRANEGEPYLDKRAKFRRSIWLSFLNYFENETMPPRLIDMLNECLSANEKYKYVSVEDRERFESYVLDIMKAEHDVMMEEIPILATLENVKVVLFKDGGSEPAIVISPDGDILGSYPNTEKPKGEVVLHINGNTFSRMNPMVEDLVSKSTGNVDKITKAKATKESAVQSSSGLMRYKKGGSAGSQGVQFQVGILAVFFLNALQKLNNWRLSTENTAAGKFDDVVMECQEGDTLLQAKHKQNKKKTITFEELVSTNSKNDNFSIPKYFLSYEEIKKTFKLKEVIICTNASVDGKVMKFLKSEKVDPQSMLYYEKCDCKFYTLNDEILPHLTENVKSYYEKNFRNKGVNESTITEKNIKDFLGHLQLFFDYPPENDVAKVIEQLLSQMKLLDNSYVDVTALDIYTKMLDWYQQRDGVYMTELYAKAILSEIWRDKHWQRLDKYQIFFQCNNLNFQNSRKLYHLIVDGGGLLQELKIFCTLQSDKSKFLFISPEDGVEKQQRVMEAFSLPQYTILVLVWSKNREEYVTKKVSCELREILNKFEYKKVVLVADCNNTIPQLIGLSSDNYDILNESITLSDLSKDCKKKLFEQESIVFQKKHVSLKEVFAIQAITEDYGIFLNTEELEKLIRGENIQVGGAVPELEEHVGQFYIKRMFKRTIENHENEVVPSAAREEFFSEEQICEMNQRIVIISDYAGTGKSTVLTNLAVTIKKKYSHLWVIRIDLNNYTKILKEYLEKCKETISIVELLNSNHSTKLTNPLEWTVFSMNEKVVLMLDGFDEISPDYMQLVLSLLSLSQEERNFAKVIVTTRPHMIEELKKILKVEPFILKPFTEENQTDFLVGYWMHNLVLDSNKRGKCEEYAKALIEKMSSWERLLKQRTDHFAAIPLHVRMLAEIFQENNKFETSDDWKGCHEYLAGAELKVSVNINVARLYKMFIEKKRSVFINKQNPSGNLVSNQVLNNLFEECLTYHKTLALELTLDKTQCECFSSYRQTPKNLEMNILKIGILQKVDNEFHFSHRTFAEYFVAESLIEELQRTNENTEFQKMLVEEILLKPQFVIHVFFNSFLQQVIDDLSPNTFYKYQFMSYNITSFDLYKLSFLNSIVQNGHLAIFQLILKCVDLNVFRKRADVPLQFFMVSGEENIPKYSNVLNILEQKAYKPIFTPRTFLEQSAASGHLEMVKFLVQQGANVNIGKFKPLHLAMEGGHFEVAKFLVEQGAHVQAKDSYHCTTVFFKAVLKNDAAIAKYLLDKTLHSNDLSTTDCIIPYTAAYLGRLDILKNLTGRGLDVNSRTENDETVIFGAVRGGQLEAIRYLVQHGHDLNSRDYRNNTALHIIAGDSTLMPTAELLVELGLNFNARNFRFSTPLHNAVRENNFYMVEFLANRGADLNLEDREGATSLHTAVEENNFNLAKFLMNHGANVNLESQNGTTALHIAVKENNRDIIKLLINHDADVNLGNQEGNTSLHTAVEENNLNLAELLINYGANANLKNQNGMTALHIAVGRANLDLVKLLLNYGANVNLANQKGDLSLHIAVKESHFHMVNHCRMAGNKNQKDIIKFLVENGANVNSKNKNGCTALYLATQQYFSSFENVHKLYYVKYLIENGGDVNIKYSHGSTILHLAAEMGQSDIINLLVQSEVDINITDNDGQTALHVAALQGYSHIVRLLLLHNADCNIRDKNGQTVLHCLLDFIPADNDVRKLVIQNGGDVNIKTNKGFAALHIASILGNFNAVVLFVESGTDINIRDEKGRTGLHLAARGGHFAIVEYLLNRGIHVTARNNRGCTALHLAANKRESDDLPAAWRSETENYLEVVQLIVRKCSKIVDMEDNSGSTALRLATLTGNLEIAKCICQYGSSSGVWWRCWFRRRNGQRYTTSGSQ